MQYNVQKNYFRCTNYQCSTKIHGFSPLPFNYHKEDIKKLLLIYANFCNDIPIFCASKNLPISKYEISRWYSTLMDLRQLQFYTHLSFVNKCQTKF